jgi:hypothetical protein
MMEIYMMENLNVIKRMDLEFIILIMEKQKVIDLKVFGKKIKKKEKENIFIKMGIFMKEFGKMERKVEK